MHFESALIVCSAYFLTSARDKILMPFQVDFYLDEFIGHAKSHQQPGYLTVQQLSEIFNFWKTINNALNAKLVELQTKYGDYYVMNAVEFLSIMLEIQPTGHGLTLALIEKFVSWYKAHKTDFGNIDPLVSVKLFEELGITTTEPDLKLLLESGRPAEKLLIDLIIVAAERNMAVEENESVVLSPSEVVFIIKEFNRIDGNQDNVLSPDEYADLKDRLIDSLSAMENPSEVFGKAHHYLKKFDDIETINIAEFVEITLCFVRHIEDEPMPFDVGTVGDNSQAETIFIEPVQ